MNTMNEILSKADYLVLAELDRYDDRLVSILNRNGLESWAVCPECHADDFAHLLNCSILKSENKLPEKTKTESPEYYRLPNGIEAKDVSGWFPANLGIAINYIWRAGKKTGNTAESDIEKAIAHLQFEIDRLQKNG
jgi:hypothetical protein